VPFVRLRLSEIASKLNSSYWFVPASVTLAGVAAALLLILIDSRVRLDPDGVVASLGASSAEGARALLSAVIGAMITTVSVTFSVTIVALTVAAQHFGPRVLNNFVRQTSAQIVLGTFLATFAYSVLALGAIRGAGADAEVPEITVTGAVVLVVLSIGALIYFVHHVSTTLQIGELAAAIVVDLRNTLDRQDAETSGADDHEDTIPPAPNNAIAIAAAESGYVQRIDYDVIVKAAAAHDAVIWIRREPGAFLVAGTPMAFVHPPHAADTDLAAAVRQACLVGRDRTLWHDPEFAVKQLVEIALRALSPGVNEPFTAITCIDRLTEGLAHAARARPPLSRHLDGDRRVRVWVQSQPFPVLARAAFDPIRIFAGANPAIYVRLLESLAELGLTTCAERDRKVLRDLADAVMRAAERKLQDNGDLAYVMEKHQKTARELRGEPVSTRR
jgi:uncharacterized membrane protein